MLRDESVDHLRQVGPTAQRLGHAEACNVVPDDAHRERVQLLHAVRPYVLSDVAHRPSNDLAGFCQVLCCQGFLFVCQRLDLLVPSQTHLLPGGTPFGSEALQGARDFEHVLCIAMGRDHERSLPLGIFQERPQDCRQFALAGLAAQESL